MRTARLPVWWFALSVVVLAGVACGGGGGGGESYPLTDYVAAVKSGDGSVSAVHQTGTPPAASTAATRLPSARLAAAAAATFLRGGTAPLPIDDASTRIIIAIQGVDGYWELTGLAPGSGRTILVTFAQNGPGTFTLRLGQGDDTAISGYDDLPVALTSVGTGDVQVNVTWDLDVDVDLHVLDPSGEEVYYSNPTSSSGGALDLDSNAGCDLDHVKAENITWPSGQAPSGTYKVLVDYYDACTTTGTVSYVVTVNVRGQEPQVFSKTFAATDADGGDACYADTGTVCGTAITEFTVP